jgi:hypothetical protein
VVKGNVVGKGGRRGVLALAREASLASHDFGLVTLAAAILRFVLASAQTAFDIDLTAFAEESLTDLNPECFNSRIARASRSSIRVKPCSPRGRTKI